MNSTTSTTCSFSTGDLEETKKKVLNWIKKFDTFCFLDNHHYQFSKPTIECLAAAGIKNKLEPLAGNSLESLRIFLDAHAGRWLFGHFGYDLKNEIENLISSHPDRIGFGDLFFFEPVCVIRLSEGELIIESEDPAAVYNEIQSQGTTITALTEKPVIKSRLSKQEYISIIRQLQKHIHRGDCYEINYCLEFYSEDTHINPVQIFEQLGRLSPNPFSALYRVQDKWLICASPERFLKKEGSRVLSQPIKGTAKRNPVKETDEALRDGLRSSQKERSENVMVVDLVRNDLSRICKEGTVQVDELYGIYTFPQVHQMISTVSGELQPGLSLADIIRACFPMGSMTGAPKKKVMELIERYEKTKRGIFSGAVGYISPDGDFDFNVVIRSILYNASAQYLSFLAGSGITFYCDPEKEWEECLLKAAAIKQSLNG